LKFHEGEEFFMSLVAFDGDGDYGAEAGEDLLEISFGFVVGELG